MTIQSSTPSKNNLESLKTGVASGPVGMGDGVGVSAEVGGFVDRGVSDEGGMSVGKGVLVGEGSSVAVGMYIEMSSVGVMQLKVNPSPSVIIKRKFCLKDFTSFSSYSLDTKDHRLILRMITKFSVHR